MSGCIMQVHGRVHCAAGFAQVGGRKQGEAGGIHWHKLTLRVRL